MQLGAPKTRCQYTCTQSLLIFIIQTMVWHCGGTRAIAQTNNLVVPVSPPYDNYVTNAVTDEPVGGELAIREDPLVINETDQWSLATLKLWMNELMEGQ